MRSPDENPSVPPIEPNLPESAPDPAVPPAPPYITQLEPEAGPQLGSQAEMYPPAPRVNLPEDLRVPWSWAHIIFFMFFGFGSLMAISAGLVFYFAVLRHMNIAAVQVLLTTNTPLVIVQQLLLFVSLLFFLYVTIAVLYQVPFWRAIGWRAIGRDLAAPRVWFFTGCGLALAVGLASSRVQPKGPMPIQELFRDRTGTLLLMAFAVLVAPLVEETVFRGFLYPVFARSFGVPAGIVVTGILFGLLHGAQLAWTWSYVGLLSAVGIIFTYARARTGTVYASYLCHLGYNGMLFLGSALATKGFTHFAPPGS